MIEGLSCLCPQAVTILETVASVLIDKTNKSLVLYFVWLTGENEPPFSCQPAIIGCTEASEAD
ncbi:hypothetical protein [Geobacillus sp. FSL K6-3411]|jgi:hypothetical protein|uniref:hypothetical protein n=1 Tax=Geobacillus sp. FSL K6-3411 TaxID=2954614 RepID=UPI0030D99C07